MRRLLLWGIVCILVLGCVFFWFRNYGQYILKPNDFPENTILREQINVQGSEQVVTLTNEGLITMMCEFPICADEKLGITTYTLEQDQLQEVINLLQKIEERQYDNADSGMLRESTYSIETYIEGSYIRHAAADGDLQEAMRIIDSVINNNY